MRRRVGELSRGYKQRVGLAEVMLHDPAVLVLDEPTSGLDPTQIRATRKLIVELGADHTIILSSHILAEVEQTCGRLIIIAGGRIVAAGTAKELRQRVTGPSSVIAEVKGKDISASAMADAVKALDGVQAVKGERAGNWTRLAVQSAEGTDSRSALAKLVADRGWELRELRREVSSLEDFFVQITYEQNMQAGQRTSAKTA